MKSGSEKHTVALDKAGVLACRIVGTPASSIEEMPLQIRVTAWSAGAKYGKLDLDHWKPGRLHRGEEYHALATLSRDLQRLRIAA
jgi:hypothetical protein